MHRVRFWLGLAAAVFIAGLVAVPSSGASSGGPEAIRPGTLIAGVPVGGLSAADAQTAVVDELVDRRAEPLTVVIDGQTVLRIGAGQAGLEFDPTGALDRAAATSGLPEIFPYRSTAAGPPFLEDRARSYEVDWWVDDQVLAELADRLMKLSARRVEEGRIEVVDGVVTAIAPAPGAVLPDPASQLAASLTVIAGGGGPRQLELSTDPILPDVPFDELEREAARLDAVLVGDVTLVVGAARTMPISEAALRRAAVVAWDRETGWDLHLLSAPLEAWVKAHRRDVQIPGVDARLAIEDPWVRIVPSVPSKVPDTDGISTRVQEALTSITRAASVPFTDGPDAFYSTADAQALGIREKIGTFTTYHRCCENRVVNIQLIADEADMALVKPGQTWSLNAHVGERTRAEGYRPAGAIIAGVLECCDHPVNIGGGTSQFATTIYNAIFFAGLEIVDHQPHTIYFSRYPEGREATLGWPKPDVVFRNNTPNAVLIDTSHTPTSITVDIYGDNGGLNVRAGLSERFRYTGPITTYKRNPALDPGTEVVENQGSGGWSVIVTRTISDERGEPISHEQWTWAYVGEYRVIEYN